MSITNSLATTARLLGLPAMSGPRHDVLRHINPVPIALQSVAQNPRRFSLRLLDRPGPAGEPTLASLSSGFQQSIKGIAILPPDMPLLSTIVLGHCFTKTDYQHGHIAAGLNVAIMEPGQDLIAHQDIWGFTLFPISIYSSGQIAPDRIAFDFSPQNLDGKMPSVLMGRSLAKEFAQLPLMSRQAAWLNDKLGAQLRERNFWSFLYLPYGDHLWAVHATSGARGDIPLSLCEPLLLALQRQAPDFQIHPIL